MKRIFPSCYLFDIFFSRALSSGSVSVFFNQQTNLNFYKVCSVDVLATILFDFLCEKSLRATNTCKKEENGTSCLSFKHFCQQQTMKGNTCLVRVRCKFCNIPGTVKINGQQITSVKLRFKTSYTKEKKQFAVK